MALHFRGGNLIAMLPDRARIWRKVERRTHDRSLKTPTPRDVYGTDIPIRLRPDMMSVAAGVQGVDVAMPMTVDMPARDSNGARVRVHLSDVLEIKYTRRRGPNRRVIETTLTDPAAAGTTALRVADTWGFEPEQRVVLETAAQDDWYDGYVESISGDTITLRSTRAVPTGKSFSAGDTVKVAWTAHVIGERNQFEADYLHVLSIQRSPNWLLQ